MVIQHLIKLFLIALLLLNEPLLALDFLMEASKHDLYQGENTVLSFILSGKAESVDIEVAKFPEFRSCWSENTVLRQGPIPLLSSNVFLEPVPQFPPQSSFEELVKRYRKTRVATDRKGIVGQYIVTPMVGREDLVIEPMKIVAKTLADGKWETLTLESKMPELTVRRLPPPSEHLATLFKGAVGDFRLELEAPEVQLRPGEAGVLRLILRGQGNYQEINEIPIPLPQDIQLLSSRSQILQTGPESAKLFEYTLAIEGRDLTHLGPFSLVYFDPQTHRYLSTSAPAARLLIAPPLDSLRKEAPLNEIPLQTPSLNNKPWFLSYSSLALQSLLAILLLLDMGRFTFRKFLRRRHQALSFIRRQKLHHIEQTYRSGETQRALHELNSFIEEFLAKTVSETLFPSRALKLKAIEQTFGLEVRKPIEAFLSEHDYSKFSGRKSSPPSLEIHLQKLSPLLHKLCA